MQQEQNNRGKQHLFLKGTSLIIFSTVSIFALRAGTHISVPGSHGPNGVGDTKDGKPKPHPFKHDFFMAPMLYLPQLFCLIIYLIITATSYGDRLFPKDRPAQENGRPVNRRAERNMKYNKALFIPPALLSYTSVCLLYVGINLTYDSSTIMFKGTVLLFTSILSVAFLGRNMNPRMWFGVFVGIIGLAVLGINDYIYKISAEYYTKGIVAGDLLIVMAQIMFAIQAVYEQKILSKYTNLSPLEALGWEGLWGFCISFIMTIIFSFVNAGAFSTLPGHLLENPLDAFHQMKNSTLVTLSVVGAMLFNTLHYWIALMITKHHGATPRMVIDSIGYAAAWGVFLAIKWERFDLYIIPGFFLVMFGYFLYFDLVFYQLFMKIKQRWTRNGNNNELNERLIPNGDAANVAIQ